MITSQLLTIRELKKDMSHARFARATESSEKAENRDITKAQRHISRNGAKKHGRSGDLSFGPSQALAKLIGRPDRQHQMWGLGTPFTYLHLSHLRGHNVDGNWGTFLGF
jgi:hypothetical protein